MNEALESIKNSIKEYLESSNSVSDGLKIAQTLEKNALDFYNEKAEQFSDESIKNLLKFLANQEKEHLRIVTEIINEGENGWKKASEDLDKLAEPPKFPDLREETGEQEVLLTAREAEKITRDFYLELKEKTNDEKGKNFFQSFADFEEGHFELIDGLLETISDTSEFTMG